MKNINLENYIEILPDPFCILDTDGSFNKINQAFTNLLGWNQHEIKQTHFVDYVHPKSIEETQREITKLSQDFAAVSFENQYRCKDSTYRILRWSFSRQNGVIFCSGLDITDLRETYDLFRLLIENSPTGMILIDHTGVIQIVNREASRIFGYPQDELIDQSVDILLPDQMRTTHSQNRENYNNDPQSRPMGTGRDLLGWHKDGYQIEIEIGLNPIHTERGTFVLSTIIDLTERKRSEELMAHLTEQLEESIQELSELASTDSLTQLKNRRAFSNHFILSLQAAVNERDQISLLLMDIDDFKSYNDSYGHPAGDRLLIEIARLLHGISRMDDFIARIGGEEFAVILPGTGRDASKLIAKRYLQEINQTQWPLRQVTVSIGVASIDFMEARDEDFQSISAKMLNEADKALYASKAAGKNKYTHFYEQLPSLS
jgi:diguanylate cyclase (GGDEF)-like protein/PAS domain S-box-containing protein